MNRFIFLSGLIILVFLASLCLAGIPKLINYQGMLTQPDGTTPVSDGNYNLTFKIYGSAGGTDSLWWEYHSNVQVTHGLFNVILGSVTTLNLPFNTSYWLGIRVGSDAELSPRIQLTSVGYAYRAKIADSATVAVSAPTGGGWTDDGTVVRLETGSDKVMIGTGSPAEKLHVNGDIRLWSGGDIAFGDDNTRIYETGGDLVLTANDDIFLWPDDDIYIAADGGSNWIHFDQGNQRLGIGTTNPTSRLEVNGDIEVQDDDWIGIGSSYERIIFDNTSHDIELMGADVGIGTTAPLTTTHVRGSSLSLPSGAIHYDEFILEDADAILGLYSGTSGPAGSAITFGEVVGGALVDKWSILRETTGGGKGLRIAYGTNKDQFLNPTMMYLNTSGRVVCSELQLTGGSDVAEPFEMKEPNKIEPGMVVVIDPDNPGKLKISTKAYDRCVAGIVSGAGGIKPGVRMMSDRSFENNHHVALTGRAYALCDASFGSIEPGDLLTTSPTSGYAMKVTDYRRAQGAILGKAMTKLDKGQGLVSVLVTLQ